MSIVLRAAGAIAILVTLLIATGCGDTRASGAKPYALTTCIVTDNDLGSMGDEQSYVHEGQEIKVCCAPCIEKFKTNPGRFLAKLP
jgi:hypothetical protein